MDDKIKPKTERSLPSKTESTDDLVTITLHTNDEQCQMNTELVMNGEQSSVSEFNKSISNEKHLIKDTILTSSQYITAQSTVSSLGERSWDSHVITPPVLSSEIVLHAHHKQSDNSSSIDTLIDSDIEIKPSTGEQKKLDGHLNLEYDYIFCIAAINKTTPNNLKLLAISKIDRNVKVDMKSDGSSLNGYAADHSGSSTSSIVCSQVEEPFLVPKVPRDSFMSLSSSGSSIGVHQTKSKPNNILLSKNVYTHPENLVCHKCNYVYPKVSDNFIMDNKDIKNEPLIKIQQENVRKSRQKRTKQLNNNNNCSTKKTLKKIKQDTLKNFEGAKIKLEEIENSDLTIDLDENQRNNPISFDIGNKVLAYWVADKLFYPAIIIDIVPPKFKVKFLTDFVIKLVNIDCLVHNDALKKGTPIAIFDTVSQEYRVGEIVSINQVNNGEITYTIDLDSEEVIVPFDKLVLDVEKARSLQNKIVFKSYDRLSLSNVSEGKRLRLSRSTTVKSKKSNTTNTKNESSKRKKTKQSSSDTNKKRRCLFPEEPDPRYIPSTSTGITEEDYEAALNPVSSDSDFDHIREELTNIDMGQLRNSEIDSEHSSPEKNDSSFKVPINDNIKVFENLHFIISYAKFKRIPTCNDSDQSTDNEVLKSSNYFKPDKVHRRYLEKLITKNGGNVQQYCNVIPRSAYKYSYIITDTPSHTCNYFLGLGLGIPSYHHKYVENAVLQKMPFPEYLAKNNIQPLPNGWSVEMKKIVFRSPNTIHTKIFSDFIIYLAFLEAPKNEFFAGLLRFCGAIVYTTWTNGVCMPLTRHTTIIITDEHCPSALAKVKVPKLSLLWLVQSLICESARPFEGHETFIAINDESSD